MFSLLLLLFISSLNASHYRGGSFSYVIQENTSNVNKNSSISVRIVQRHSWRRSAEFCNDTRPTTRNLIGDGVLISQNNVDESSSSIPPIDARVRCTDFSESFDYSSGEDSKIVLLPKNRRIEYIYEGCCWISLLSPDEDDSWSMKLIVNTQTRADGRLNNSPRTTMNPIVRVELGQTHLIRIPMGDTDGDQVRCRWGNSTDECGGICSQKGFLRQDPCELTYIATKPGYQAVALVIEDFDSNNAVLSAVPLQFLIHIVDTSSQRSNCSKLPEYVGDWPVDSCIGVQSNEVTQGRIQMRIPCNNTNTILIDILTISPAGFQRSQIEADRSDPQLYSMFFQWTPRPDQFGIQQVCFTPVDSSQRTGAQVCLTFEVDTSPPKFISLHPTGLIAPTQSVWTILADQEINPPRRSNGIYIRIVKSSNNLPVYLIDVNNNPNVFYHRREIVFFTNGHIWEEGESYHILVDSGVATINQSCRVESNSIDNRTVWTFEVANVATTMLEETEMVQLTTTTVASSTVTTTIRPNITQSSVSITSTVEPSDCPRWVPFQTISDEITNVTHPQVVFCFNIESELADVTITANTWVSCLTWKTSGSADPLIELYSLPQMEFLAQNDDGNDQAWNNCYAAVLSHRLPFGVYRVVIRHPKCSYGKFQLSLSTEIDNFSKSVQLYH